MKETNCCDFVMVSTRTMALLKDIPELPGPLLEFLADTGGSVCQTVWMTTERYRRWVEEGACLVERIRERGTGTCFVLALEEFEDRMTTMDWLEEQDIEHIT